MITENLSTLKIYKLTQEQYERKLENGEIDQTALYFTDEEDVDMDIYATVEQVNGKADAEHSHEISDVNNLQSELDTKADSTHNHDSSYDALGSADTALQTAKTYTDEAVAQKSQVQIITWGADD